MKHAIVDLRAFFRLRKLASHSAAQPVASRNVMMHVTLDTQHATPLRRALIRDCAGQPWTIRMTPLCGTDRIQLTLYLPRSAIKGAMQRVTHLAPTAEIAQMLDVPAAHTDAWRKLMHRETSFPDQHAHRKELASGQDAIARYLKEDHVLLGLAVADRESLFAQLANFLERQHGLSAEDVVAGLAAREALGSTALGQGVAVPHGQIKGLQQPLALYVRPNAPVLFDAPDGKPVTDLVVLFVPEWANMTHLQLLADVAQRFCDQRFREQLHASLDACAICRLFAEFQTQDSTVRVASH